MSMTISALNARVVVSFFENGQLNLTKLFSLEELDREQVDTSCSTSRAGCTRVWVISGHSHRKKSFSALPPKAHIADGGFLDAMSNPRTIQCFCAVRQRWRLASVCRSAP